ncbi:hypothetical protein Vretimale_10142 [Volvox reticuliferus]|uniref:Uncharacterized protein n=1 Tax=Volvox reticuliferus TaxID=1737510 RepID=A0A8J4GEL6_9CHLO|nr:hypothetical protein Vretimale_10142 [Volvox reticuliferus]
MSLQRHCLVASRRGLKPAVVLNALPQVPKPTGDCTNIPALPTESIRLPPPAAVTTLAASPVVQPVLEAGPQQVQSAPLPPARIAPCCLSIVTGASRGLGAAIARVLVMRGPPLPASRAVEAINKTHADHSAAADGTSSSNGGSSGASKAVSPSPCAALGLTHDLILLASDSGRLSQFVRTELAPLLEQQQQPQPQHAGEHKHYRNHPPAPSPLQLAIVATRGNTDERPPSSSSAEAVISVAQAHTEPSKPPSHFTRVHTACFDLGDLELLEEHVSQLLMAAPGSATSLSRSTGEPVALELETSPATSAAAVKAAGAPVTAMTRSDAATSLKATSIISDHYGGSDCSGGAGRGSGLLPLPLSAYTHVLLVHNAGQVRAHLSASFLVSEEILRVGFQPVWLRRKEGAAEQRGRWATWFPWSFRIWQTSVARPTSTSLPSRI